MKTNKFQVLVNLQWQTSVQAAPPSNPTKWATTETFKRQHLLRTQPSSQMASLSLMAKLSI